MDCATAKILLEFLGRKRRAIGRAPQGSTDVALRGDAALITGGSLALARLATGALPSGITVADANVIVGAAIALAKLASTPFSAIASYAASALDTNFTTTSATDVDTGITITPATGTRVMILTHIVVKASAGTATVKMVTTLAATSQIASAATGSATGQAMTIGGVYNSPDGVAVVKIQANITAANTLTIFAQVDSLGAPHEMGFVFS